jgi:hypothetical protein
MNLTDTDRQRTTQARELAEAASLEEIRKAAGSGLDTYAEAYGVARVRLGDLLAIIDRLDGEVSRLRNDRARYRVQLHLPADADDQEALREAGQP